jgi:peptidoglycan/xylan/chitin deacetylase (PgdA/CDA1 family)
MAHSPVAHLPAVGRLVACVDTRDAVVALTFDDGPAGAAAADSLIAVLRRRKVHATFFVTGGALAASPTIAARLVASGHELGNHS